MIINSTMVLRPDLTTPSFLDVTPEHWAFAYIEAAAQNGFVKGYPDGTFKPEGNITIAEVLTVIVRVKNFALENPPGPPPWIFLSSSDCSTRPINPEDWFYQYVGGIRGKWNPPFSGLSQDFPGGSGFRGIHRQIQFSRDQGPDCRLFSEGIFQVIEELLFSIIVSGL